MMCALSKQYYTTKSSQPKNANEGEALKPQALQRLLISHLWYKVCRVGQDNSCVNLVLIGHNCSIREDL